MAAEFGMSAKFAKFAARSFLFIFSFHDLEAQPGIGLQALQQAFAQGRGRRQESMRPFGVTCTSGQAHRGLGDHPAG